MAYTISSKNHALRLRRNGASYNKISRRLGVAKSTLSCWLHDLPVSQHVKQLNIDNAKVVWAKNIINYNKLRSLKYQKEKIKLLENYARQIPLVDEQALFWIGLALFWAEGGRRERFSVRFANSDPVIIKAIMQFFRKICKVDDGKFTYSVHLHPNIEEIKAINFWLKLTQSSFSQFRKSQTRISSASKRKRPIHQLPFGTLHITICDTALNKKIMGWLMGLSRQFNK